MLIGIWEASSLPSQKLTRVLRTIWCVLEMHRVRDEKLSSECEGRHPHRRVRCLASPTITLISAPPRRWADGASYLNPTSSYLSLLHSVRKLIPARGTFRAPRILPRAGFSGEEGPREQGKPRPVDNLRVGKPRLSAPFRAFPGKPVVTVPARQ